MMASTGRDRSANKKFTRDCHNSGARVMKDRNKRTEAMLDDQIILIKQIQDHLQKALESLEKCSTEEERQRNEEVLAELFEKSEEVIVVVQVLMKLRNELAYARLELEHAVKSRTGIENAKRRVKWLQDRLEKTLLRCRSRYIKSTRSKASSSHGVPSLQDQISEKLWNRLPEQQKQRLNRSESSPQQEQVPMTIMEDVAKMVDSIQSETHVVQVLRIDEKEATEVNSSTKSKRVSLLSQYQEKIAVPSSSSSVRHLIGDLSADRLTLPSERSHKRKKKKKMKVRKPTSPTLHAERPDEELFLGGESDTTPEPVSDADEASETRSESMVSTVGTAEEKPEMNDLTDVTEVSSSAFITETEETIPGPPGDHEVPEEQEYSHKVEEEDEEFEEKAEAADEEGYWEMDHHKFEWSDFMMSFDPRSWHALGIVVPNSFLNRDKPHFLSELPWKEKPKSINSVLDVHKLALDKLLVRLHRMYDAVGKVTQATIDPLPKDKKMETVMGKIDVDTDTPVDGRPLVSNQGSETQRGRVSREVTLPPIQRRGKTATRSVVFEDKPEKYRLGEKPSGIRISQRSPEKQFPRISNTWCEDLDEGYKMPRLVKSKPKLHTKASNVQSRYLPRKEPAESPEQRDNGWKPFAMLKLIQVARIFESEEQERVRSGLLDYQGPKWKRVKDLLSDVGLASSNTGIATGAAKSLGQLACSDSTILDALGDVLVNRTSEARLCHEASKSLILLGSWDANAMKVVVQNIVSGNDEVVAELLSTMTKAKDIPFVDKNTPEFQELSSVLIHIVRTGRDELAFEAAISLGRLCVVEPVAKVYLIRRLPLFNSQQKAEALYVLIKQLNCKTKIVFDALLEQLDTSHNWKHRVEAAELLIFVGAREVFRVMSQDDVFDILERLLWDHANKQVRHKIAKVLGALNLRQRACALVLRRLEDPSEDVRAKAVISLATLGMKGVKEMKALLDILELDPSPYVRIQVVRAFSHLDWNDPRVIRSLKERERGEGTLAKEAGQALYHLIEAAR